jgi:16S rRNA (guanine527-N7)-methyltransferase
MPADAVSRETSAPEPALIERLFGARAALAYRYADLLAGTGVERGLLGPREAPRLWQRHLLNCAVVHPAIAPNARVCDIGSGAGLPGVVLAIARPDLHVTLLEPLLRRATFLSEVVETLGLDRVVVRRVRAEEVRGRDRFDVVTARAVARLDVLIGWGLPLVRAGGELMAWKGEAAVDELAAAAAAIERWGGVQARIETHGSGLVIPPTTVIRIGSNRTYPPKKGSR